MFTLPLWYVTPKPFAQHPRRRLDADQVQDVGVVIVAAELGYQSLYIRRMKPGGWLVENIERIFGWSLWVGTICGYHRGWGSSVDSCIDSPDLKLRESRYEVALFALKAPYAAR